MVSQLKRRKTYEEIVGQIERKTDKITYPNRDAKFIRNSFQLSQLDGIGSESLEELQMERMKHSIKQYEIQKMAIASNTSIRHEKAKQPPSEKKTTIQPFALADFEEHAGHADVLNKVMNESSQGFFKTMAHSVFGQRHKQIDSPTDFMSAYNDDLSEQHLSHIQVEDDRHEQAIQNREHFAREATLALKDVSGLLKPILPVSLSRDTTAESPQHYMLSPMGTNRSASSVPTLQYVSDASSVHGLGHVSVASSKHVSVASSHPISVPSDKAQTHVSIASSHPISVKSGKAISLGSGTGISIDSRP